MILGNPYKFSVFISTIKEWNIDNEFCNGVLLFCIEGNIFPKKIVTATLKYEIQLLKEKLLMKAYIICKEIKPLPKYIILHFRRI